MPATPSPVVDAILTGRFDERPPYHVVRSSGTTDHLLTFTLSGSGVYRIGGSTVTTGPGHAVLLHPRAPHDYAAGPDGWSFVWAHFHPRPHWEQWLRWRQVLPGLHHARLPAAPSEAAGRLLSEMHDHAVDHRPFRRDLARALLEQALILVSATFADRGRIDPRVERAIERLSSNPVAPLDIDALARAANLSPSRFAHLFSDQLGETPLQFHERLRVDLARRLLSATSLTVKEIAESCGFSSQFYFSLRFKRATGKSPTAWRRG